MQQRLSKHNVSIFNDFISFCTKGVNYLIHILSFYNDKIAGPVAARSKSQVCGRWPAEIVGSNPTQGMDVCLL